MSILFFKVSVDSDIAQEVNVDQIYTDQCIGSAVYRVDTDVNTMTKDELQTYLPAFYKAPQDYVEMSGISLYQD